MNKYPFYYEVRFKVFKYDQENELFEYKKPICRIFKDKTPLENRKDAFDEFEEFLLQIEDRLYQNTRGNYVIIQPPYISEKLRKRKNEDSYYWYKKKELLHEDISLFLIINDETIIKDFEEEKNEFLIHRVSSIEFEEQNVIDNLDMIEVPLYENFKIDISGIKETVYHYGLDYSESGEVEEDGAKRTILSTPFVWKTKSEYENDIARFQFENSLLELKLKYNISDNDEKNGKYRTFKPGTKGITYESLFAEYLVGATDITITDPYIRLPHQKSNFLEFISLIRSLNKHDLSKINLKLITYYSDGLFTDAKSFFDELEETLRNNEDLIHFSYEFDKDIHDRIIETNTGWRILLGRGLDIYKCYYSEYFSNTRLIEKHLPENRSCNGFYIHSMRKE